jgi:hypothetical protein
MSFASLENRQTFESLSDLILRVNEHFDFEDYVVVILRKKKFELDVIRKTWLICDRDERIRESQDQNRRHIASKSIECSFFMIVKRLNDFDDSSWLLKVINSKHNHFFSLVDAHFVLRKMTMTFEVKNEISCQLIVQIASSQIISSLRIIDFIIDWDNMNLENSRIINFMFKSRDIYNMKAQLRREAFDLLTLIQALIQELNRDDWTYDLQKDENNQVTHLFFSKESSQSLLKKNFEILIMNCIYKSNKYKMSLLIISDQTTLHINFYVTFCFMTQKTIADYFWVLNQLKALYNQLKILNSITIVIDMKRDLMQAISVIFSDTNHLFCLWHININVVVNCKRNFDINETWNVFFFAWKSMIYFHTKEKYEKNWKIFLVRMFHFISNWWSICKAFTSTIFASALSNALRIVFYILTLSQHLEMRTIMQCWSVVWDYSSKISKRWWMTSVYY